MSDRALFAAFQKVKAQVDDAVSLTREREARARAEEEKARAAKKTRVVKAAETRRAEAGTASISASAFSATGGFGAALADAAKSSGASFRMAAPAKSRGGQPVTAPKAEPSAVRKHAQMSPSTKAKEAQGKRHDAKADRAGRRPSGEQAGIRNERSEGTARQSGRTHSREGADRQKTVSSEAPKRRLSYEERRNPVPPFTLMPGLPVSERGEEVAKAIRENRVVIVCGETGSGKTTLLHALERRGALVLDCDAVYHEMLRTDAPLRADLTAAFGDVFAPDGGLDRQKLGNIVFGDAGALAQLDAIIFRHLPRALARRMEESGARLIALDAIKLVESGLGALCDVTVAVTAPEEVRVRRIMTRDGISEDYARARVRAQRSEEAFRADCDEVFENNYPTPAQAAFAAEEFLDTIIKKSKEE